MQVPTHKIASVAGLDGANRRHEGRQVDIRANRWLTNGPKPKAQLQLPRDQKDPREKSPPFAPNLGIIRRAPAIAVRHAIEVEPRKKIARPCMRSSCTAHDAASAMTNPSRGPSLLQARDDAPSNSHPSSPRLRHDKSRDGRSHPHPHKHQHQHPHKQKHRHQHGSPDDTTHADRPGAGPDDDTERKRDILAEPEAAPLPRAPIVNVMPAPEAEIPVVTHVVKTVSLIHLVNPLGVVWKTQTVNSPPNKVVGESWSEKTPAVAAVEAKAIAPAVPGSGRDAAAQAAPPSSHPAPVMTPPSPAASSSSRPSNPTPPLSVPIYHPAGHGTNFTKNGNSSYTLSANSSHALSASSFVTSLPVNLTSTDPVSSFSPTSTPSTDSATSSPSVSFVSSVTGSASDVWHGGFIESRPPNGPPPTPNTDGGGGGGGGGGTIHDLSPQQKQVIGGVVGSVAGVAFLALLVLLALRYRRRRDARQLLGGGPSEMTASRSVFGGDGGSGISKAMVDRSPPTAVAAALASLSGKRSAPPTADSAEGGEKGFYRVSGRKLPSVFLAGGDGFSDPRASIISGHSDYFRGSQAFEPDSPGVAHLALGAPMRPVSGVPIIRCGPCRTPVTEGPYDDETPCTPVTYDTSGQGYFAPKGSPRSPGSRFQERV
ncbi:hypothetical protein RJ55_04199 [Drechmeria coniospora]|nr:hypothetical protein RJ55_04199 [Drechmeria coniospora]